LLDESHKIGFLIDECVGLPTINLLRELGYSVITVKDALLDGEPDSEIFKQAVKEKRILVTEDIEFGNIILYPHFVSSKNTLWDYSFKISSQV
jgi:predicted nuclease of predicted toxin-antitoxin system